MRPLTLSSEALYNLEDNLLLFFTGYSRSASEVLHDQNRRTLEHDESVESNLTERKGIAYDTRTALEGGDFAAFARLLSAQWEQKKRRSSAASNGDIDGWYELGMASGALGGKLVGAGGGGFLMFYAEDRVRLRRAMLMAGLPEVRFRFDFQGAQGGHAVVTQSSLPLENNGRWDRSNVEFRDGRILACSKDDFRPTMRHIDYGLGLLRRGALEDLVTNAPCDLGWLYQQLLERGQLAAYEVHERFYQIGSLDGIEETARYLASRGVGDAVH